MYCLMHSIDAFVTFSATFDDLNRSNFTAAVCGNIMFCTIFMPVRLAIWVFAFNYFDIETSLFTHLDHI